MAPVKKPIRQLRRHFLRKWREHRGYTQEQAADYIKIDRTTLGRIESLKVPYSQGFLEAAAEYYKCEPWDLLNVDPTKEGEVIDFTAELKKADPKLQAEILGYARGRLESGTKH